MIRKVHLDSIKTVFERSRKAVETLLQVKPAAPVPEYNADRDDVPGKQKDHTGSHLDVRA